MKLTDQLSLIDKTRRLVAAGDRVTAIKYLDQLKMSLNQNINQNETKNA